MNEHARVQLLDNLATCLRQAAINHLSKPSAKRADQTIDAVIRELTKLRAGGA